MASAQLPLDVVIIPLRFCQQALARAIRTSGAERVYSKDPCIMCKARDLKILASIPGIDWVAVVTKVTRKFSDVTGAIVPAAAGPFCRERDFISKSSRQPRSIA